MRFDRYLLPKTAVRQSLGLYSGRPDQAVMLEPTYDVVERVVTYRLPYGQLQPGLLYEVQLVLPADSKDGSGFRAFDGAPLVDDGKVPLHFSFRTARTAPSGATAPKAPSCNDALSIFANGGCASCHQGTLAPMGLRLDSGASLRETAVSRVAREAEGPNAAEIIVDPGRFGVGMPLIDPGSPSSSYLVYKLLTKPENFGSGDAACRTTHLVPLPRGECLAAPADERARLQDWFVRLDPMPLGSAGLGTDPGPLRALTDYIRAGASTAHCD